MAQRVGLDVGGSGIKGALVDLVAGEVVGERLRVATPSPAEPRAVAEACASLVADLGAAGPVGVGFPAVVVDDVAFSANNIDPAWVGTNVRVTLEGEIGSKVSVINDADAAALCEARYGAARGVDGLVLVLTFGSGIGSGMLVGGELVRNVELGIIELEGHRPAEEHFSAKARKVEGLSWDDWGSRANRYLSHVVSVLSPHLVVVSGGVSKRWDRWAHRIDPGLPVVRAERVNNAGIVGAASLVG